MPLTQVQGGMLAGSTNTTTTIQSNGTTAITVNSSQNVGVGTASPQARLHQSSTNDGVQAIFTGAQTGTTQTILLRSQYQTNNGTAGFANIGWFDNGSQGGGLTFGTTSNGGGTTGTPTERMRIDSSGNLLVGTTSAAGNEQGLVVRSANNAGKLTGNFICTSSAGSAYGVAVNYSALAPNTGGSEFYVASDSTNTRFYVNSNGGIGNYSANNVNLSDVREKNNIELAGSYLDKICSIPVKTFNYIDQNREDDDGLTLGVIAQDVQAVAPELVSESDWSVEKDGSKMRLSIYQTDLQYALMKSIQELKAELDATKAEVAALKAAP